MIKVRSQSEVTVNIVLGLSESEARALDALVGYGHDPLLKVFYKELGEAYMKPHEKGLVSLFETLKVELPQHLRKADKAREALTTPAPGQRG